MLSMCAKMQLFRGQFRGQALNLHFLCHDRLSQKISDNNNISEIFPLFPMGVYSFFITRVDVK